MPAIHEKLKQSRELLGLTQAEVAERLGFKNYQTILKIEDGTRNVKADELSKLAKIYGRSVSYFLEEEAEEVLHVLWREKPQDDKDRIYKEESFKQLCANYQLLKKKMKLDSQEINLLPHGYEILDFADVRVFADKVSDNLKLGVRPACSIEKVLEEDYGVKIIYLDLSPEGSGASTYSKEFGPAILVNRQEPPWRRHFSIAHELFHLLTWEQFDLKEVHPDGQIGRSKVDQWANYFASCLLLPETSLRDEFCKRLSDGKISILDVIAIGRDFYVSLDALLWRLSDLQLLKRDTVANILRDDGIRTLDKVAREKWEPAPYISERFVFLAFSCYQKGFISKGTLAEFLRKDRAEVDDFLEGLGYNEEEDYNFELTSTRC